MKQILSITLCIATASSMVTHTNTAKTNASTEVVYSLLTVVQAKIKSLSSSNRLACVAKTADNENNQIAQDIDAAATEFIACLAQEIEIELMASRIVETHKFNAATTLIIKNIYRSIPEKFKCSTIHRSNLPLSQRLLDSIKQADEPTLLHIYTLLEKHYNTIDPNILMSVAYD